ncbi:MAG: hypothetical protein KKC68_02520, partial [Candidatus Thermoplasmatota archaeon]|nr:hypothetical protein [Candidatus Thermoplasmatota archaeon]
GIFAHIGGSYNNDRMDLTIDRTAEYCAHKPLIRGNIALNTVVKLEVSAIVLFAGLVFGVSIFSPSSVPTTFPMLRPLSTLGYILGGLILAFGYNRWNKSIMFVNVIGQFYAGFVVLMGMSIVTIFNPIIGITALIIGLNGIYLNIIEADIKDIAGDVVNVPKALGVRIENGKAFHIWKFYLVNDGIKIGMFFLILYVLVLEDASQNIILMAILLFMLNYLVRILLFKNLGMDREYLKRFIAAQEITAILLISTIYMVINPWIPVILFIIVVVWLVLWNKLLWGTYLRPQV